MAELSLILPWSQYFDLKGQLPPKSSVRNISISNIKGTGSSLGKIIGNPDTDFGEIILKDAAVQLKNTALEMGELKGLKFENVVVNGAPITTPVATKPAAQQ